MLPAANPHQGKTIAARATLALCFWLANVVLHLEFSNWIVRSYDTPFGPFVPRDHSPLFALLIATAVMIWLAARARTGNNRSLGAWAWAIWAGAALLGYHTLMTTPVEAIHYLQYALLYWLLAAAVDPQRQQWPLLDILALVCWLGVVDELNQYFYLTPGNGSYVDFNDFLLNLVGGLGGMLAYYSFPDTPHPGPQGGAATSRLLRRLNTVLYGLSGLALLALLGLGRVVYTPEGSIPPGGIAVLDGVSRIFLQREPGLLSSWQPSFTGQPYYVMGWWEFALVSLLLLALLGVFRYRSVGTDATGTR